MNKLINCIKSQSALSNHYSQNGIALLLSLLISFIVAFALAIELLNIQLNEKNIGLTRQQDQLFYMIEKKMNYWILNPSFYLSCLYSVDKSSDPNKYPKKLLQKEVSGCIYQEKNMRLSVVTEDLGLMPCINIEKLVLSKKVFLVAHFYRMSVLGNNAQNTQTLLQMVFAVPEPNTLDTCSSKTIKVIREGRQSWRIYPE